MTADGSDPSPPLSPPPLPPAASTGPRRLLDRMATAVAAGSSSLRAAVGSTLSSFGRPPPRPTRPPAVGVFGKHPGFGDHITLPMADPVLRGLWQTLYNDNIRSVIEQGTWAAMAADGVAVVPFGHWFCGGRSPTWVVGRLWASADAVGRREYPMVAVAALDAVTAAAAVRAAWPVLENLEMACRAATAANGVVAAIEAATAALAHSVPGADLPSIGEPTTGEPTDDEPVDSGLDAADAEAEHGPEPAGDEDDGTTAGTAAAVAAAALASNPTFAGVDRPLLAVLSQWADVLGRPAGRRLFGGGRRHVTGMVEPTRVPIPADPAGPVPLAPWVEFAASVAAPRHGVFAVRADGQPWVDIVVGPLQPSCCAAIRAPASILPPLSPEPPDDHPPQFLAWAAKHGA